MCVMCEINFILRSKLIKLNIIKYIIGIFNTKIYVINVL